MSRSSLRITAAVLISLAGTAAARAADGAPTTVPTTMPADTSAKGLLEAFDAVHTPKFDKTKVADKAYQADFRKQMGDAANQRTALAKAIYERYPDEPRAGSMLLRYAESTQTMMGTGGTWSIGPITDFLKAHPDTSARVQLLYYKALVTASNELPYEQKVAAIAEFDAAKPNDAKLGQLTELAIQSLDGPAKTKAMETYIAAHGTTETADTFRGELKRGKAIGQPLELAFDEATTGKHIDLQKDLRGKVVVLDFWATWCHPCVGEMPEMKKLYAEYAPRGVEFIGVSLDQAGDKGKASLLKFVVDQQIAWPQYYQGDGWDSAFSKGWGIESIPSVFVVGTDGKLVDVDARGKLNEILPKLLGPGPTTRP